MIESKRKEEYDSQDRAEAKREGKDIRRMKRSKGGGKKKTGK